MFNGSQAMTIKHKEILAWALIALSAIGAVYLTHAIHCGAL
jgi:hypothetical protein